MTRQQKRKALRDLDKEYKKIANNRQFARALSNNAFKGMSQDELDKLTNHTHPNKELQAQYDLGRLCIARLKEIDKKRKDILIPPDK